jgi:hypothetical protein
MTRRMWPIVVLVSLAMFIAILSVFRQFYGDTAHDQSASRLNDAGGTWQVQLARIARSHASDLRRDWPFSGLPSMSRPMPMILRRRAVANLGNQQLLGLRFNHAKFVRTPIARGIWVVRGAFLTCIFQAVRAAASCGPDAYVFNHGLQLGVGSNRGYSSQAPHPSRFLIFGIEPDGVRAVIIRSLSGHRTKKDVVHNAFAMQASSPMYIEHTVYLNRGPGSKTVKHATPQTEHKLGLATTIPKWDSAL